MYVFMLRPGTRPAIIMCSIFFLAVREEVAYMEKEKNRRNSQKSLGAVEMIPTQISLVSSPSSVAAHQGKVISRAIVSWLNPDLFIKPQKWNSLCYKSSFHTNPYIPSHNKPVWCINVSFRSREDQTEVLLAAWAGSFLFLLLWNHFKRYGGERVHYSNKPKRPAQWQTLKRYNFITNWVWKQISKRSHWEH